MKVLMQVAEVLKRQVPRFEGANDQTPVKVDSTHVVLAGVVALGGKPGAAEYHAVPNSRLELDITDPALAGKFVRGASIFIEVSVAPDPEA